MENATKALIIAGAILVAILLVTMGITLLSNTKGIQNQQDAQQHELNVESFNGQLKTGIGNNVSGSNVIDLIDKVDLKKLNDPDLELEIVYNDGLSAETIRPNTRYSVSVTKKDESGYITEITVSKKK